MNSLSSDYMSLAILAAIASAALHPWMTALSKKGAHPLTVNFWGVILAGLIFSFVYFRIGFWGKVMENWELIVISGILHATYVMLVLPLIARHEFQVVYPLTRVVPIFVLIGEILILGTSFAALKILGVCLVVSGALIFGFDKKINGFRVKIAIEILLIAMMTAGYFLVDKKLLSVFTPAEMWAMVVFQLPILGVVLLTKKKEIIADLKNFKNTTLFALSMIGTWFLALTALKELDGAVVTSLRNLSIIFGVFLGAHLFDEGHKVLRYLAAILICGGAFLTIL